MSGMKHLLTASAILTILTAQAHAQWTETVHYIDTSYPVKSKATSAINTTGTAQTMSYNSLVCAYTRIVSQSGWASTSPNWQAGFQTLVDDSDEITVFGGTYLVQPNSRLYLYFDFDLEDGQNTWYNSEDIQFLTRIRVWETWNEPFDYGCVAYP